jgi:general secretion pathway protein G
MTTPVDPSAAPSPQPPPAPKTSGHAIASLILGLAGFCTAGLGAIVGIILGIVALRKISAGGGRVTGRGLAIGGVVVSCVGLLVGAAVAVVVVGGLAFVGTRAGVMKERAMSASAAVDIANLSVALDAFEVDCGRYPTTEEGLQALAQAPAQAAANWRGPYVRQEFASDPWGNPYVYRRPGLNNVDGYDLYSCGPDGQDGGGDDVSNWGDGGGMAP